MKRRSFAHRARAVALWALSISAVFASLPARAVRQIRLRCVASETVLGIMGITLLEAVN